MIEKLFMLAFLPYFAFLEWLRDRPRRFTPPAPPAQAGTVRRHDGSGRTWPTESSELNAPMAPELPLVEQVCRHERGCACAHAAEPPSASDAIAAFGEQRGRHGEAGAPYRHVPANWAPPTGKRWVRAATEETCGITARQISDVFAGAR